MRSRRMALPRGCFNAAIAQYGPSSYCMVYRRDEYKFVWCLLDRHLDIVSEQHVVLELGEHACADPRLLWLPGYRKLLMVYSSLDNSIECVRAAVILDQDLSDSVISRPRQFQVSPKNSRARQKNWTPFACEDKVYLVASTSPHVIFELDVNNMTAEQRCVTEWIPPWHPTGEFLRGNTNPVQLDDGAFLGTFHTAIRDRESGCVRYDNGVYVFEGQPPFRVLRCADEPYLSADDAREQHYRKLGQIACCFPCGMIRENERLLISYGSNDSAVLIGETTVTEMLNTTVPVYDV